MLASLLLGLASVIGIIILLYNIFADRYKHGNNKVID